MITSWKSTLKQSILAILFVLGNSSVFGAIAGYLVPDGYFLTLKETGKATIKLLRPRGGAQPCVVGSVIIGWEKINGVFVSARIKHLEVMGCRRGQGVGSRLFDYGLYKLMKVLGAPQVSWCAQPLDSSRTFAQLVEFYKNRGGMTKPEAAHNSEMCLTEAKIACVLESEGPGIDLLTGEELLEDCEIEQKITLQQVLGCKNQCVLRGRKFTGGEWILEQPYIYTEFGRAQYAVLAATMMSLSDSEEEIF